MANSSMNLESAIKSIDAGIATISNIVNVEDKRIDNDSKEFTVSCLRDLEQVPGKVLDQGTSICKEYFGFKFVYNKICGEN